MDHPPASTQATAPAGVLRPVTAIILAGSRPGVDPLAQAAGVKTKALVPIAGRPMVDHVARTLLAHPRIGTIILMAQEPEALADHPQTQWLWDEPNIHFHASGAGISQSLRDWMDAQGDGQANNGQLNNSLPALVTTADNVLLTGDMLDVFLARAMGADIAAAMVERNILMRAYPQSRRTWLKFRGGAWSGANLFWLGGEGARPALDKWREIEQNRKKGWKIISAFGLKLLLGAALGLLTVEQAMAGAGRRLGVARARIISMPMAEACIDADKPDDIRLIEEIMARSPYADGASPTEMGERPSAATTGPVGPS
ncbi:MAG: 4-diphosphocytidyl-2C-methyl-D-erythritol synthase [Sphingobium sp.]|nr:4-diphosphocytidyl-2C-methyl-D-erythritol synthase [Sphingobium sp.]